MEQINAVKDAQQGEGAGAPRPSPPHTTSRLSDSLVLKLPVGSRFAVVSRPAAGGTPSASESSPDISPPGKDSKAPEEIVPEGPEAAATSQAPADPNLASLHVKFSASTRFNNSDAPRVLPRVYRPNAAPPPGGGLRSAMRLGPTGPPGGGAPRPGMASMRRRSGSPGMGGEGEGEQSGTMGGLMRALSGRHRRSGSAEAPPGARSRMSSVGTARRSQSARISYSSSGRSSPSPSATSGTSPLGASPLGPSRTASAATTPRSSPGLGALLGLRRSASRDRRGSRELEERALQGAGGMQRGRSRSRSRSRGDSEVGRPGRARRSRSRSRGGRSEDERTSPYEGGSTSGRGRGWGRGSSRRQRSEQRREASASGDEPSDAMGSPNNWGRPWRSGGSIINVWDALFGGGSGRRGSSRRRSQSAPPEGGTTGRRSSRKRLGSGLLSALGGGERRSPRRTSGRQLDRQLTPDRSERTTPTRPSPSMGGGLMGRRNRPLQGQGVPQAARSEQPQRPPWPSTIGSSGGGVMLGSLSQDAHAAARGGYEAYPGAQARREGHRMASVGDAPALPPRAASGQWERNGSLAFRVSSVPSGASTPTLQQDQARLEAKRPPQLQLQPSLSRPPPFVPRPSIAGGSSSTSLQGAYPLTPTGRYNSLASPAFVASPTIPRSSPTSQGAVLPRPPTLHLATAPTMPRAPSGRSASRRRSVSLGRPHSRAAQRHAEAAEKGHGSRSRRRHGSSSPETPKLKSFASSRRQRRRSAADAEGQEDQDSTPSRGRGGGGFFSWLSGRRGRRSSPSPPKGPAIGSAAPLAQAALFPAVPQGDAPTEGVATGPAPPVTDLAGPGPTAHAASGTHISHALAQDSTPAGGEPLGPMAASLASADADRTLNNRRRPAPVLIPSSPLPPLVAVQMQQTVPSRERKGAWSKLGKVFGVVVPKRWRSPNKPQASTVHAQAVTTHPPVASAAPGSRPTPRASSTGITDAQLPAPAFLVPRPGAATLSLPAGATRPSFRLHRSGSGSPPSHSRISQVHRLSEPTVPEAGSRPALARPLPGPAASPGKDQGTGAAGDVSLGTPFASADAVAAVRNEAKDKTQRPRRGKRRAKSDLGPGAGGQPDSPSQRPGSASAVPAAPWQQRPMRAPAFVPRGRSVSPLGRSLMGPRPRSGPAVVFVQPLAPGGAGQVLISPLRSSGGFGDMRMSASPTRTARWGVDAHGVVLSYARIPTINSWLHPGVDHRPLSPPAHLPGAQATSASPVRTINAAATTLASGLGPDGGAGATVDNMIFPAGVPLPLPVADGLQGTFGSDQPLLGSVGLGSTGTRSRPATAGMVEAAEGADALAGAPSGGSAQEWKPARVLRTPLLTSLMRSKGMQPEGAAGVAGAAGAGAAEAKGAAAGPAPWSGAHDSLRGGTDVRVAWPADQLSVQPQFEARYDDTAALGGRRPGLQLHVGAGQRPPLVPRALGLLGPGGGGAAGAGLQLVASPAARGVLDWEGGSMRREPDGVMASVEGPIDMRGSAATGSLRPSPLKAAPALPPSSFRPHRPIRVGQPAEQPPYPVLARPARPPLLDQRPPYSPAPAATLAQLPAAGFSPGRIPYPVISRSPPAAATSRVPLDDESSLASSITVDSLRDMDPVLATELRRRELGVGPAYPTVATGVWGVTVRPLRREVVTGPHLKLMRPKQLLRQLQPPGPTPAFSRRHQPARPADEAEVETEEGQTSLEAQQHAVGDTEEAPEGKPLDDDAVNDTAVYRPGPVASKLDHGVSQPKAAALRSEPQGHVTVSVPAGFRQEAMHVPPAAHEEGAAAYEAAGGAAGDDVDTERRPRGNTLVRVDGAGVRGVRTLSPPRLPAASLSPPRLLRLTQDPASHQPTRRHVQLGIGTEAAEEPRYRSIRLMRVDVPGGASQAGPIGGPQYDRHPNGMPMGLLRVLRRPEADAPGLVPATTAGRTEHLLGMLQGRAGARPGAPGSPGVGHRVGPFDRVPGASSPYGSPGPDGQQQQQPSPGHASHPPGHAYPSARSPPVSPQGIDIRVHSTGAPPPQYPAGPPPSEPYPYAPGYGAPPYGPHPGGAQTSGSPHHPATVMVNAADPNALAGLAALSQLTALTSLGNLGRGAGPAPLDDPTLWPDLMETTPETMRQTSENVAVRMRQQRAALSQPNMGVLRDMAPSLALGPGDMLGPGPLGEAQYARRSAGGMPYSRTGPPGADPYNPAVPHTVISVPLEDHGVAGAGGGQWIASRSPEGQVLAVGRAAHEQRADQALAGEGEPSQRELERAARRGIVLPHSRGKAQDGKHGRSGAKGAEEENREGHRRSRRRKGHRRRRSYSSSGSWSSGSEGSESETASGSSSSTDSSGKGKRRRQRRHRRTKRNKDRDAGKAGAGSADAATAEGALAEQAALSTATNAADQKGSAAAKVSSQPVPDGDAPRPEPGDDFGLDVAERLLQRMAEPEGLPGRQRGVQAFGAVPGAPAAAESGAGGGAAGEGGEEEPSSPRPSRLSIVLQQSRTSPPVNVDDSDSPNAKMADVLRGPFAKRRAEEIIARQAALRAKFLAAADQLQSAAAGSRFLSKPPTGATIIAGMAEPDGPHSEPSLAPIQQPEPQSPPQHPAGHSGAFAAPPAPSKDSPEHAQGKGDDAGRLGQRHEKAAYVTSPRSSPPQAAPTQQPIQIYCTQLVLQPGQGPIVLPGVPSFPPPAAPASWAALTQALPGAGGLPSSPPADPYPTDRPVYIHSAAQSPWRQHQPAVSVNAMQKGVWVPTGARRPDGGPELLATAMVDAPGPRSDEPGRDNFQLPGMPPAVGRSASQGPSPPKPPVPGEEGKRRSSGGGGGPRLTLVRRVSAAGNEVSQQGNQLVPLGPESSAGGSLPGSHPAFGEAGDGQQSSSSSASVVEDQLGVQPEAPNVMVNAGTGGSGARQPPSGGRRGSAAGSRHASVDGGGGRGGGCSQRSMSVRSVGSAEGSATLHYRGPGGHHGAGVGTQEGGDEDGDGEPGPAPEQRPSQGSVGSGTEGTAAGAGTAAGPENQAAMAAELTQLIMQAFQQSGGTIQPEPTSTRPAQPRPPHAASAPSTKPPEGAVDARGAAASEEGAPVAADASAAPGAAPALSRLPGTLPNAAVPRGQGPAFLQVRDIALQLPAEGEPSQAAAGYDTHVAGSDTVTNAILGGLNAWEEQAMAALHGRPQGPPPKRFDYLQPQPQPDMLSQQPVYPQHHQQLLQPQPFYLTAEGPPTLGRDAGEFFTAAPGPHVAAPQRGGRPGLPYPTASEAIALDPAYAHQHQLALLQQRKEQRSAAIAERQLRYRLGLEHFAHPSQPPRPLALPPPSHPMPPDDYLLPLPPDQHPTGTTTSPGRGHTTTTATRATASWQAHQQHAGHAYTSPTRTSHPYSPGGHVPVRSPPHGPRDTLYQGHARYRPDQDTAGPWFGGLAGGGGYLPEGVGVEARPHPASPLQLKMHGEVHIAQLRRSQEAAMSPRAAALYQHQLRFNRQATGRGHPAARTVSFAPDTLGGREHEEYGEYGASPTRVPYMARFGPEAAAVRSLAAMVAQRAQEGGVGASGLGDTRLPRDARDGSGGWGLGREGEDVSEEYDKTDPHADTECGGCDFPACPVRAAQEEDRQAEDARQASIARKELAMQEAAQRAAARHLHGGQGDDGPTPHHHQGHAVRRPTPDQVAAQRVQREADRAQLLDGWAAEMRAIRAAADRAEATKKVVVSSTQQALASRRERQTAELQGLFALLGEVDQLASAVGSQAKDTKRMMQALEEEASLRQAARLNALLTEAQQLGGEVDRILGEGEGAGGEAGAGSGREDRAGGGGEVPQAGAGEAAGLANPGAAAGVA